jgi:hypothetical protein
VTDGTDGGPRDDVRSTGKGDDYSDEPEIDVRRYQMRWIHPAILGYSSGRDRQRPAVMTQSNDDGDRKAFQRWPRVHLLYWAKWNYSSSCGCDGDDDGRC